MVKSALKKYSESEKGFSLQEQKTHSNLTVPSARNFLSKSQRKKTSRLETIKKKKKRYDEVRGRG